MTLGLRFHHGGYTTQGGWPRKKGELRKPRTPESMLALTKGGAGSHTQTSRLCTGGGPAGKRLLWCGLGYCSVRGFLLFVVLCFRSSCSLSNPNNRGKKPGQWKGIIWKLGALKTPPHGWQVTPTSPWWRQEWCGGWILAGCLPWRSQSSCPPKRGWPGSRMSPEVYRSSVHELSGWRHLHQLPVQHFPKMGSSGTNTAGSQHMLYGGNIPESNVFEKGSQSGVFFLSTGLLRT